MSVTSYTEERRAGHDILDLFHINGKMSEHY